MAGLQKKAGKKALAAAAPPPKPSENIIAPPAPARYKSSADLTNTAGCTLTWLTLLDTLVYAALAMQEVPRAFKELAARLSACCLLLTRYPATPCEVASLPLQWPDALLCAATLSCSFAPAAAGSQRRGPSKKASAEVKSEDHMTAASQSEPADHSVDDMQTIATTLTQGANTAGLTEDAAVPLMDRLAGKLLHLKQCFASQ